MQMLKTADSREGAEQLYERLCTSLASGKSVLWLLTGGSGIAAAVSIFERLEDELTANLTVALTDERYGQVGHPDSNWQQYDEAEVNLKLARRIDTLDAAATSLEQCAASYNATMQQLLSTHDVIVGQFGIGPDGHTAGILPHSTAVQASGLVFGYQTNGFARITMTFEAIRMCHVAYALAFGDNKHDALQALQQNKSLDDQPAQIFKQLPEAYVYNDQIGEQV